MKTTSVSSSASSALSSSIFPSTFALSFYWLRASLLDISGYSDLTFNLESFSVMNARMSSASLPLRRPELLHPVADNFLRRRRHLAPTGCLPFHSTTSAFRQDKRDGQVALVNGIAEMREQSDEVFGFLHQFAKSAFGSALGEFEDVRWVFWHRQMRISELGTNFTFVAQDAGHSSRTTRALN
jgi:hypothetical protein